jgi:alginate O-acetyltransferase complex protein AlgI
MVLHGLAKKVLLADNLATYVNVIYGNPAIATTADLWMATYAFAFQVYCDFSGYTDIAIGSSLMMGIKVPPNFNVPFMASSIRDLWHRQHISLSHWFRDYVYFSLGGSRCSRLRSYFNLILTTSLAGLWHGAAWHHVMWGLYQGGSLIVHREWMDMYKDRQWLNKFVQSRLWHVMAILITFNAFCISYVFFRANTNSRALYMLGRMLKPWAMEPHAHPLFLSSQGPLVAPMVPFIVVALAIAHILSEFLRRNGFWSKIPRLLQAIYCAFLIFMMLALMPDQSSRFIYFQF